MADIKLRLGLIRIPSEPSPFQLTSYVDGFVVRFGVVYWPKCPRCCRAMSIIKKPFSRYLTKPRFKLNHSSDEPNVDSAVISPYSVRLMHDRVRRQTQHPGCFSLDLNVSSSGNNDYCVLFVQGGPQC